jgi:EmrB/QacA subfamily drug resistance transporter
MSASPALRRPLILASVMASMFMIAIEATIVSTAMPQIASQLGDLHLYSWVFSSFLLAQTATTVVFGKLSDLYGRKPIMLFGIAVFVIGSVLCGAAWSMTSLIVFRLIQGLGAGAIQPIGLTIVGDLYSVEERGKIQGYLASVWGISSVMGPLVGGLIIQHFSWSWIFWLNVPIALIAAAGYIAFLRENVAHQARNVDVIGAALFATAVASLMVALTEVGTADTGTALIAAAVFVVSSLLFVVQERRARDPMLAFGLWARRHIATANLATLLSGMTIIGLTTFLPMYVQGVLGQSALIAGFTLTAMVLGWPIGATLAARNFHRFGLRRTLVAGACLLPVGASAFLFLDEGSSPWMAAIGSLVVGFGMGFLSNAAIVIIQASVGWAERGSATASNIFARNLGSTLGATILGAVFNISLTHQAPGVGNVSFDEIRQLLNRAAGSVIDPAVTAGLGGSLHLTFIGIFVIALLTLLLSLLVPGDKVRAEEVLPEVPATAS